MFRTFLLKTRFLSIGILHRNITKIPVTFKPELSLNLTLTLYFEPLVSYVHNYRLRQEKQTLVVPKLIVGLIFTRCALNYLRDFFYDNGTRNIFLISLLLRLRETRNAL